MKLQKPKRNSGFILPQESAKWQYVEDFVPARHLKIQLRRNRTPILSTMKSSAARSGDTTNIVTNV